MDSVLDQGTATFPSATPNPGIINANTDISSAIVAAEPTSPVVASGSSASKATPTAPNPSEGGGGSSALGPASKVVEFDDQANFPNTDRVYDAGDTASKSFSWALSTGASVSDVEWLAKTDLKDEFETIQTNSVKESSDWFNWVGNVTVTLNLLNFSQGGKDAAALLGTYMAIRVNWQTRQANGSSTSGFFAVARDAQQRARLEPLLAKAVSANTEAHLGSETTSTATALGHHSPTPYVSDATSLPSGTPTVDPGAGLHGSDPSSSHNGGGGLATGAIVGIAVGVGLVVIVGTAALIWFILRQRRQKKLVAGGYDTKASSNRFIEDKQSPHTQITESNLRYSDDQAHTYNETPLVGAHNESSSRAVPADEARPGGVPRNVAHLVEDGMTEEEIQRLEAEERHLDDEIERAGRAGRR